MLMCDFCGLFMEEGEETTVHDGSDRRVSFYHRDPLQCNMEGAVARAEARIKVIRAAEKDLH